MGLQESVMHFFVCPVFDRLTELSETRHIYIVSYERIDFNMKTVLITGASGGIGSACVKAFWDIGYNVAAVYCNSSLDSLADYTERVMYLKADISSEKNVISMFDSANERFGIVDAVVNCAGVSSFGLIQDVTESELTRLIDINVKGSFYVCREAAKRMVSLHSGSIVNVSSIWGQTGASCEVIYSMTKAAVIGLTKALAKELGPSGIRVNCIAPGLIDTKMNSHLDAVDLSAFCEETPLMRMGTPQEVADAAVYLSCDKASFVTGQILGVNGGYLI